MKFWRRNVPWLKGVAILLLLAGWFLHIHDLDASSLWLDELRSFERASLPDWDAGREALVSANHAPLYEWIVLRTWLNLGQTEFLARLPGAFLSLLAISVTYALATVVFRRRAVGIWSMFFFTLSPLYLNFTRWIRPYALLSLLLITAVFCLWRALGTGKRRYWLAYGLLIAGTLYTHYYAIFTVAALGLFVILRSAAERKTGMFRDWALSSILSLVLFLPWLSSFRTELSDGAVEWIEPLRLATIVQLPTNLIAWDLFDRPIWIAMTVLAWAALAVGLVTWLRGRPRWPERWGYPYVAITLAGTVFLAIVVSLVKPLIVPRYFIGVLPALCILFAFVAVYGRPRLLALGLAAGILLASFSSTAQIATRRSTEDWRSVAQYVEQHAAPGDRVVVLDQAEHWTDPFQFYYRGEAPFAFLAGQLSDSQAVQAAIDASCPCDRLWLAQSVRRTSSESLAYEPDGDYSGFRVVERVIFDEALIRDRLAVDLWLLVNQSPG